MGVSVAAAFAVVNRIDDFAYTPEQNIAHAMTALMAQNKGARKKERMREGFRCGMKLELIYGVAVFAVCFLFARPLRLLFVKDEEVIRHGVSYLHLIAAMYLLPAATNGIQGYFRGIGDLKITLISSFINMGVRVLAALPLVFLMGITAMEDICKGPSSGLYGRLDRNADRRGSAAGADLPEGNGWELILDFWMEIMYDIKQAVRENAACLVFWL